jgi:small subunit ribosomal protein S2
MDKKIEELFKINAHLGHKSNRVHPKAKKFIYRMENGVSIIDLVKTVQLLKEAQKFLADLKAQSKKILFVVTKKNCFLVEKFARLIIFLISQLNAGGLLTNFENLT